MKDSTFLVGMDIHADSVSVSVFSAKGSESVDRFEVVPDDRGLARLVKRLKLRGSRVRCVYEAGPCGYELQRYLSRLGVVCEIAAPSLVPRRPGERVKTDRRDAEKLGRLYRAGELALVAVPSSKQEALRDLLRAREDAREDLLRIAAGRAAGHTKKQPPIPITQEVREFAAAEGLAEDRVLAEGLDRKAREFRGEGSEIYRKV